MSANRARYQFLFLTAAVAMYVSLGWGTATAQQIYLEQFEDDMLEPDTTTNFATIAGGVMSVEDASTTSRGRFVLRRELDSENPTFNQPVMTFSFDTTAPVVVTAPGTSDMELVFRAGIGTGNNTLSSSEFIIEAILFRTSGSGTAGGARGDFLNNGNETMFLVANNRDTPLTFASPMDGTDVTLNAFEYIPYIRDNETGTFGQLKGIDGLEDRNGADPGFGDIIRLGIGSSSNGHQGTFAIDNVQIVEGVSFAGIEPLVPGDVDGDGSVTTMDFDIIAQNFRLTPSIRTEGDLNGDNIVSLHDFVEWKTEFLMGGGSVEGLNFGFLSVPEPSSFTAVVVALLLLCVNRIRPR